MLLERIRSTEKTLEICQRLLQSLCVAHETDSRLVQEPILNWNVIVQLLQLVFLRHAYHYIILTAFAELYREYSINDFRLRLGRGCLFRMRSTSWIIIAVHSARKRERERFSLLTFSPKQWVIRGASFRAYGDNKRGDVTREPSNGSG